ncbi:hypothetical protein EDD17DRAFT_1896155, partial [Pisolithus thermaeus]
MCLTRNLSVLYADVRDEIIAACNEFLEPKHNGRSLHHIKLKAADVRAITEWKPASVLRATLKIVSRASNRVIVVLPLYWLQSLLPIFLNGLIGGCFDQSVNQRTPAAYGSGGMPTGANDYLQWSLDALRETCPVLLMRRMLSVNFPAVHSTSQTFYQALLNLAENLQHAQVLRDEVEEVVSEHGWTKEAFRRCEKSTVFSKKLSDLKALGLTPTVTMSDFTLADGSFVPQGTILAFPVYQIHHDDAVFGNPNAFEP